MRSVQLDFRRKNRTVTKERKPQDARSYQTSGRDETARAVDRSEVPGIPIELVHFELIGIIVRIQEFAFDAIYPVSESVTVGKKLRIIVDPACAERIWSETIAGVLPLAWRSRAGFAARQVSDRY